MINNKSLKTLALAVYLWCVAGDIAALGLGEAEIYSSLGHPLVAEIPVFDASDASVDSGSLIVGLADEATHLEAGLEYPYFLRGIRFTIDERRIDAPLIRVTTLASIAEPLFSFLIELRWPDARLFKQVTVLLDPPSDKPWFAQVRQEESAKTDAGSRPVAETPPTVRIRKRARRSVSAMRGYGPVASGETLSRIAAQLRLDRNVGLRAMMIGLFNKNPHAFGSSMDVLKRGVMLDIPTDEELASIAASERSLVKATQSPVEAGHAPVHKQAALRSATLTQTDAESARNMRLHILSSEPGPSEQAQHSITVGEHPESDDFYAFAAHASTSVAAKPASNTSMELRLERAARDLKMLRAENESMRKAMANMQNDLLVNSDRFEKMMKKYEQLLEASNKARVAEPVTSPYAAWVPWLTLLLAIGVVGGIGMIGWKTHNSRHKGLGFGTVGAKVSSSIPLDEILDSVHNEGMLDSAPAHATVGIPSEHGYRSSQGAAGQGVLQPYAHVETAASEASAFEDRLRVASENNGSVIAEYLATGEFNITDANIAREIVNSEGNSEVKLVLLTFYKELGRNEDLQKLADEILERHPNADPDFLKHVLAIRNSAAEAVRRSAVGVRNAVGKNEVTQHMPITHVARESEPHASPPSDEETASEDVSTAIYQKERGDRDSDPSEYKHAGDDEEDTYQSQQDHNQETVVPQARKQSEVEEESDWPELYEVFATEAEILEQQQVLDDSNIDASTETKATSTHDESAQTQPLNDTLQTKQSDHAANPTVEFAPGLPDPSLLEEPSEASDDEVVDTQMWIDSGAQTDTVAHNREDYDEWFQQLTGSDSKE